MAWLAEFVADTRSKYLQGAGGRTAYERLVGKPVREEGLEFGERVLFRPKARADANVLLEGRWLTGTWLGRRWGSTISRVHSKGEVVDARAVQRVPLAERWSAAGLEEIRATPWCVRPPPPGAGAAPVVLQPLPAESAPVPFAPEPAPYRPRRVFTHRADLEQFGYTAGCRRCMLTREGSRAQGIPHKPECRARIEQALRDTGDPRVGRVEDRFAAVAAAAAGPVDPAAAQAAPAAAPAPAAVQAAAGAAPAPAPAAARAAQRMSGEMLPPAAAQRMSGKTLPPASGAVGSSSSSRQERVCSCMEQQALRLHAGFPGRGTQRPAVQHQHCDPQRHGVELLA